MTFSVGSWIVFVCAFRQFRHGIIEPEAAYCFTASRLNVTEPASADNACLDGEVASRIPKEAAHADSQANQAKRA
jgi:hypothetical protein